MKRYMPLHLMPDRLDKRACRRFWRTQNDALKDSLREAGLANGHMLPAVLDNLCHELYTLTGFTNDGSTGFLHGFLNDGRIGFMTQMHEDMPDAALHLNNLSLWVSLVAFKALCMDKWNYVHMNHLLVWDFVQVRGYVWDALRNFIQVHNIPTELCANGQTAISWQCILQLLDLAARDDPGYANFQGRDGARNMLCAVACAWKVWLEHPGVLRQAETQ